MRVLTPGDVIRRAEFSDDGRYRYELSRVWEPAAWTALFIMLNPSTADGEVDDPTIRRCMGFARSHGYGGIRVLNLFAFRSTNPRVLAHADDPVGPANDENLRLAFAARHEARMPVIAAWGALTTFTSSRAWKVGRMLARSSVAVQCLGTTKAGDPRHPLYVRGDQPLEPWSIR